MRGVLKSALALAAVALLAIGLGACGGGDSESSTPSSTTATTRESTSPARSGDSGSDEKKQDAGGDDGGSGRVSDDAPSDDAPSDDADADEGSASFRVRGGDNSIQNFGAEADGAEVAAATSVLASYLAARAGGDWAKQCTLLAKATVAPLEQLAARSSQLEGKGCAAILVALMGHASAAERANPMTAGIASLRFEGDRGFALFHGAGGADYFIQMAKEDGSWKVAAIAPNEFP